MEVQTALMSVTRGGQPWVPRFVQAIDRERCIGCGRCFKVCGREVLNLVERETESEDEEAENMVMAVVNPDNCIGCEACAKVCPKKCYTHAPLGA